MAVRHEQAFDLSKLFFIKRRVERSCWVLLALSFALTPSLSAQTQVAAPLKGSPEESAAQVHEVNALAAVLALQPTRSPTLWELLGSSDGIHWAFMGTFELLHGEVPPRDQSPSKPTDRIPVRVLVGSLALPGGKEYSYAVVSATRIGERSLLPKGSLLFAAYALAADLDEAVSEATRLSRTVATRVRALDFGRDIEP